MNHFKIIQTKYIGPTNHRGARIKAVDANGNTITVHWQHEKDVDANHKLAAQLILDLIKTKNTDSRLELTGFGDSVDGKGYIFTAQVKEGES